jgi:hypothetical protein
MIQTYKLLSWACVVQAGVHLRGPHLHSDASAATFPCHQAFKCKNVSDRRRRDVQAQDAMLALVTCRNC